VEYPPANFGIITTIRFRFVCYWAWAHIDRCQWAGRDVIAINRSVAASLAAYTAEIDK